MAKRKSTIEKERKAAQDKEKAALKLLEAHSYHAAMTLDRLPLMDAIHAYHSRAVEYAAGFGADSIEFKQAYAMMIGAGNAAVERGFMQWESGEQKEGQD